MIILDSKLNLIDSRLHALEREIMSIHKATRDLKEEYSLDYYAEQKLLRIRDICITLLKELNHF